MITKQQALEFIYDLSQETEIMLDVPCGEMQFKRITGEDYLYTAFALSLEKSTLEATVTNCIKEHMDAIMNYVDKIPVDIDMLEVGQTYKVVFNEAQITDELTKIDDNNVYFRRHYPIKIRYIREIYKENKCR